MKHLSTISKHSTPAMATNLLEWTQIGSIFGLFTVGFGTIATAFSNIANAFNTYTTGQNRKGAYGTGE